MNKHAFSPFGRSDFAHAARMLVEKFFRTQIGRLTY